MIRLAYGCPNDPACPLYRAGRCCEADPPAVAPDEDGVADDPGAVREPDSLGG